MSKKEFILTFILFIMTGMGSVKKLINTTFLNKFSNCDISIDRYHSIQNLYTNIDSLPKNTTIGSTGGIINSLLKPGIKIYHHLGYGMQLTEYDYFIVEKGDHSNTFPQNNFSRMSLISELSKSSNIFYEDKYFIVFKSVQVK